MSLVLRAITASEVPAFRSSLAMGFGKDRKPEGDERFLSLMPLERTIGVFDGDSIVGTLGDFPLHLTVPGGSQLATAGTTMVTVRATHTRRGILRSMMKGHLDAAVERGEPVAALWASEPAIYGRFGFGLATEFLDVKVDARHVTVPPVATDIEIEMIAAAEILDVVAPFWHRVATEQAGFIDRDEARWRDIMADPEMHREGGSEARHVIARRGAEVVGYLPYRQHAKWESGVGVGGVSISALVASDVPAHLALWSYALSVDLFPMVSLWNAAIDDPLPLHIRESRAVKRSIGDALYVRLLDVASALSSRTYERDGELVIEIADAMGYANGTFRLAINGGVATVDASTDPHDVSLDVRELGALYLGRACADSYARSGLIDGDAASIRSLGQLFATGRAPWCPEEF